MWMPKATAGEGVMRTQLCMGTLLLLGVATTAAAQALPLGIPDPCKAPGTAAVKSGAWSNPATWNVGRVPAAGDQVGIPNGVTVTYDGVSDAAIGCIGVHGALMFQPTTNTRLTVVTLLVYADGAFSMGSAAAPVGPAVTAELVIADQPLDTAIDPEQYQHGLLGFGTVTLVGATKTPYVRLTNEVAAGSTTLALEAAPTGWRAGDRLVLPDSKQWFVETYPWKPETEVVTLQSVNGQAAAISAAAAAHPAAFNAENVTEFYPHVAELTRNVVVRSASKAATTRGHVLFTGRANVDLRYAAFQWLGRTRLDPLDSTTFDTTGHVTHLGTNQIGRYALHFHHYEGPAGQSPTFSVEGCVVESSSKWATSIHDSHFGRYANNVIYDAQGTGIMLEDGNESFNTIEGNFVVATVGTSQDTVTSRNNTEYGFEGSGIWLHGPNNYVRNNIVAASNAFGVTLATLYAPGNRANNIPLTPGADMADATQWTTKDLREIPILQLEGNEIYGSKNGLTIWDVGAICCETIKELPVSIIKNTRLWHISRYGFYGYGANKLTFDGWVQRGDWSGLWNDYESFSGFYFEDYEMRNLVIKNADIEGLRRGILIPAKTGTTYDIYGTTPGEPVLQDSLLKNFTNVMMETPWGVTAGGTALPARKVHLTNVRFGHLHRWRGDTELRPGQSNVLLSFQTAHHNTNTLVRDELVVQNYDGTGRNFQVYYGQQAPSGVVPQSAGELIGLPVAGLTNAQAWAQFQQAIAGAVAPCSSTEDYISGFVCAAGARAPASSTGPIVVTQ